MKYGNDTAFPMIFPDNQGGGSCDGLTKREYFAAAVMQGILASDPEHKLEQETISLWAIGAADSLIEELNYEK